MSLSWQTVAEISAAAVKGIPFQYRDKDALFGGWHDSGVQTLDGMCTLSRHDLRAKPASVPEAEAFEKAGNYLHAAMHFRANGFEEDALRCNRKAEGKSQ